MAPTVSALYGIGSARKRFARDERAVEPHGGESPCAVKTFQ
jgi:hypothetical protein